MRAILVGCVVVLAATTTAWAQTNDGVYRQREWDELVGSPRAIGMGGAFVAVADDYSAAALNPAGLGLLPKNEIGGDIASYASATQADSLASTGMGMVGGAARITPKWTLGGFVGRPLVTRRDLGQLADADHTSGPGWLNETVTLGGVAGAWTPRPGLHVGMSLLLAALRTDGLYHETNGVTSALDIGISGGSQRVISSVGALLSVGSARLGIMTRTGATWSDVERRSVLNGGDPVSESFPVRMPSRVSAGAALQASPRLLLSVQGDYVRYSEIQTILAIRRGDTSRADYALKDQLEARAGAEVSWPIGDFSLQLRAGLHARGGAALAYEGDEAFERTVFAPADDRMVGYGGVSLVSRAGLRMELAIQTGHQRAVVGGASVRF